MSQSVIALGLLLGTLLVGVFFAYIYSLKRQNYLLYWTVGWALYALHYLCPALSPWIGTSIVLSSLNHALFGFAAICFFLGAQLYTHTNLWLKPAIGSALFLALWSLANAFQIFSVSSFIPAAFIYVAVGYIFWNDSRHHETLADQLLGLAFSFWGIVFLGFFLLQSAQKFIGDSILAVSAIPVAFVCMLLVMAVYEEEKRRVERNMLALSNLNLATSSFVGGEIQRMLAQALDRVLGVVRLPSGALFLHHGDTSGPTSVVSAGIPDAFCNAAQEEGLDDYLVGLVSRLGGLLGFRDLRDDNLTSLENDEPLRRFRELALKHGLRSVVVISLQAKEQAFGLLLLGTPDNRRFTSAELRLLLALGHQIGMAVENSYLVQQTSRRSEELHVLNEIGRALSSTLNKEDLLRKIWEELRRLFDVENLYIASPDPVRDAINFDLEMIGGERMPMRSRPAGNHLTEYIIRTRQPVLIRENYVTETRKLGIDPIRISGSFCGVPLVAYDQAIGALCIYSDHERAFDEGHLELLRVLASEASIAIENARLFQNERTKARHLSLLNLISRDAIATLNPDEVLTKITEQLENGLNYDHIGIALLDYTTRELVIQAESGARRGALARRLPLDTGLIGQVARTGKSATYRSFPNNQSGAKPVLPESAAAMGLPIFYADHLHGVLYVETLQPVEFSEEESLLLRTLADLVSGALHNALTFQKAQEQAITDGLTGVKTHRFFMEALSSEWKRSSRASRAFALVLMDLDRFKFVNDFYGHLEGDLVLQRVGQILETNCRRSDVVARYGGDEFVILMPETTMEQARQLSSKLRGWVAADPLLREKNISASFGIACYPLHGASPQELIQVADASMYLSKHQGGNTVSTADHVDPNEARRWKRDVLEAYLGVTLKRLFTTGPEAFDEIYLRLRQFTDSLPCTEIAQEPPPDGPRALPQSILDTVTSLAYAIDAKDQYTQGHSQKVSAYAALLAEALGMSDLEVEEIRLGAVLHDVGKVGIPEAILNKSGPLNLEEWDTMKTHVTFGGKLLEPLVPLARIREMVLHHHEFFDGSGYPEALAAEKIPLGARIITIADSYDTITSDRSYKKGRTAEQALNELERCAGTQFDPQLVAAFVRAMRQLPNPIIEVASLLSRTS
ncbi:MAG TPA: diguanylate cyclase [Candidatus Sulfotelmatobacter sp.]|jgi:diguanylate cyclase (GGDEF)-like protein|nr:diguanylate cyclase [Candidatus Sulfotelmatobacter sp.]